MTIRVPRININGTAGAMLAGEYDNAIAMVNAAINQLLKTTVHGRDYPPFGSHAYSDALREHRSRLTRLNEIRDELELIHSSILEQNAGFDTQSWNGPLA